MYIKYVDGRCVILYIEIDEFRTILCNVYGPNYDNIEFYVDVIHQRKLKLSNYNRIIGGDFNLVLNLDIDKKGGNSTTNTKSQALINDWMDDTEFVDIWRFHHPDSRVYCWDTKRPTPFFCRLDFFLVSFGISGKIKSSNISPGFRSDHSVILIDLIPFETKRGITDVEWKTALTMFSVNSTCRVISFLIPMLLCELSCLKKETIVWICVIFPYSTVGIWGVDVVLLGYAANW